MFNGSLAMMVVVLGLLAGVAWWRGGSELVGEGLGRGGRLMWDFGLLLVVSFLAAGLATALVPQQWIEAGLGRDSGLRGIVVAAGVGAVTPAGPFVAMPIAAAMLRSGAAIGPVVAFLTGWSLLAVHRLIAWEIPIVGLGISLLRWSVCLLLPILAGLLAHLLADR